MRVLISDDHAVFRRGLRETLAEAFPRVAFGEATTAQETLDQVRCQDWDVVILDISMPGKSGLDILDDLKRLRPKLPILLLSMHPEQQFARRALKAGAAGYLTKDGFPEDRQGDIDGPFSERQDGEHVSRADHGKDGNEDKRGSDPLRPSEPTCGLALNHLATRKRDSTKTPKSSTRRTRTSSRGTRSVTGCSLCLT